MITKLDMMDSMLEACPSFRPQWDKFLVEWNSDDDKPLYLALAGLARHLIQKLATGDVDSLSTAFAVVERWHKEGDSFVREAATIGLLEDLQNENLHESTTPMEFEPFLLTESAKSWKEVDLFWRKGEVIFEE
jgi:hypothetical protein